MGLFSKDIKSLDDLFVHTLQDIYYAEKQIVKVAARHDRKGDRHRADQRLQEASGRNQGPRSSAWRKSSSMHGHEPKGVDCPAIDGILKEAKEIAGDVADKQVLDAALIAAAQAVEHYEITRYGTLDCLGEGAGPAGLRQRAPEEPRRGKDDRRETDQTGHVSGQQESRVKPRART